MAELLTVEEVARECRVHPITVRRHIAQGRLPAVRLGRSVRVKREDLEHYLKPETVTEHSRPKTGFLKPNDPLFDLIGIISDPARDVSANKYKYLAEEYYPSKDN